MTSSGVWPRRVFLLALLAPGAAAAQDLTLPLMEPGRYAVGWKAFVRADVSRPYADAFVRPGQGARPVLFAVWYPAPRGQTGAQMKQADYLRLENVSPTHSKFLQRLTAVSRRVIGQELAEAPDPWTGASDPELLRRHLDRGTLAIRGAPAAAGKFPLLIYHPGLGGFFGDSSPLAEHLASHGHVVVASAFQPTSPETVLIDADLDRSRADAEFILQEMRTDPQVDLEHVGLFGHSFGASASLATTMRNRLIDAVASLDSTLDHPPLRELPLEGDWAIFLEPERLVAPALILTAKETPKSRVRYDLVKSFTSSERLLVELPGIEHNDFIWHGASGAHLRGHPSAARRLEAYRTVMSFVQQFFDAHLKENDRAIAFLATQSEEGPGFRFERLAGSKPVPSGTALGAGLVARGLGPGLTWLEATVKRDALPYPAIQDMITALQEREHHDAARLVAEMSVKVYPDNFRAFEVLGELQAREKQWDKAEESYRSALRKLGALRIRPVARKTGIRLRLTARLDRLKQLVAQAAQAGR
jgi:dienelactone hydrolase